jgi:hypothetical protein
LLTIRGAFIGDNTEEPSAIFDCATEMIGDGQLLGNGIILRSSSMFIARGRSTQITGGIIGDIKIDEDSTVTAGVAGVPTIWMDYDQFHWGNNDSKLIIQGAWITSKNVSYTPNNHIACTSGSNGITLQGDAQLIVDPFTTSLPTCQIHSNRSISIVTETTLSLDGVNINVNADVLFSGERTGEVGFFSLASQSAFINAGDGHTVKWIYTGIHAPHSQVDSNGTIIAGPSLNYGACTSVNYAARTLPDINMNWLKPSEDSVPCQTKPKVTFSTGFLGDLRTDVPLDITLGAAFDGGWLVRQYFVDYRISC